MIRDRRRSREGCLSLRGREEVFLQPLLALLLLSVSFPECKVHTAIPGSMALGLPREELLLDEQQRHLRETWLLILCTSTIQRISKVQMDSQGHWRPVLVLTSNRNFKEKCHKGLDFPIQEPKQHNLSTGTTATTTTIRRENNDKDHRPVRTVHAPLIYCLPPNRHPSYHRDTIFATFAVSGGDPGCL